MHYCNTTHISNNVYDALMDPFLQQWYDSAPQTNMSVTVVKMYDVQGLKQISN